MEDSPPPPAPAPVIVQNPAPVQQTAKEAAMGSAEGLEYLIDRGVFPRYAQQLTDIQREQAPQMSQINLDQQKIFGPQLTQLALDNLKTADPTGFQIRDVLGKKVLEDLKIDGGLSPEETRLAQQQVRASQTSRGLGTGLSDAISETDFLLGQNYNRRQQTRANAASFLSGQTPQASFASLNQAGQTAPVGTQNISQAAGSLIPSTNSLVGLAGQNYGQMSANTNAFNQLNSANHWQSVENTTNPFLTGVGVAAQLGGALGGAALMCWVAENLYGKDSEKTHAIRSYVLLHLADDSALGEFCREYQRHGKQWAEEIKHDEQMRKDAYHLWDILYDQAIEELNLIAV